MLRPMIEPQAMVRLFFGLFLGLGSCSLFTVAEDEKPATPGNHADLERQVESFQGQLEAMRGLDFIRPITSVVITREDYQRMTDESIDSFLSDSLSVEISRELAQWGYFPDTLLQYKSLFKDFEGGFAAGFYIGGSDSIFILEEYAENQEQLIHIIPHELAHALQDQYGRLNRPVPPSGDLSAYASDILWFHTALVEGEAYFLDALITATYTYPQPDPKANALQVVRDTRRLSLDSWRNAARPNNLFLPSIAPYQFGPALVGNAYAARGWDSLEALYAQNRQPSATAIDGESNPLIPFDFAAVFDLLDTAGAFVDQGCHGSIGLMSWLNQGLDSAAFFSGMGWRGDRYAYARKPGQRWGSLVWAGLFDDSTAAARVQSDLAGWMGQRFEGTHYPDSAQASENLRNGLPGIRLLGSGLTTYIFQSGSEVYLLEGLPDSAISLAVTSLVNKQSERLAMARQSARTSQKWERKPNWNPGNAIFYAHRRELWRAH